MLKGLYRNIFDNPILTRELRRRMRGKALVYSIIGYIILMSVTSILILIASQDPFTMANQQDTQKMLERLSDTGQTLFRWISMIQALLVLVIAPTITAGMTTGEKEKKTFDFLRVTTITPWMYIVGCFLSTFFYVGLALLCALPLISLAFLYGGIGRQDVIGMTGILLGSSMVLSSFGLFVSSIRERTRTAQGIVVFMIFAVLFGGTIIYSQVSMWLGTGGGAAGGGTAVAGGLVLFGWALPPWVVMAFGMLVATVIFLLVATRKLFDPDETRAFSHWQFALIAGGILIAFVSANSGQALTNVMALGFMTIVYLILIVAAVSFSVGRMEVGDEIWHLKRLVPFLRPFDQTVPFLVLIGVAVFLSVESLTKVVATMGTIGKGHLWTATMVGLAGYAFFCVFGRFATAMAVGRKGAGRWTMGIVGVFWIAIPLFASIVISLLPNKGSLIAEGLKAVARLSPFVVMIEGIDSASVYASAGGLAEMPNSPAFFAIAVYLVLAVAFLALGEYKRLRRWRGFNYHYDMPAA